MYVYARARVYGRIESKGQPRKKPLTLESSRGVIYPN